MKSLAASAILTLLLTVIPRVHADPKPNFNDLGGTYSGKMKYELSGMTFPGKVTVTITPSPNGRQGIVTISGSAKVGTVEYPVAGVFEFRAGSKVLTRLPYLGLALIPGTTKGTFKFRRIAIKFSGKNSLTPALTFTGNFGFRFTNKKRILTLNYTFLSAGTKITGFTVNATSRIPKTSE